MLLCRRNRVQNHGGILVPMLKVPEKERPTEIGIKKFFEHVMYVALFLVNHNL